MDEAAARAVLGVGPGAGPEEVRTAFRRAVAAVHPDRSPAADAAERTRAVTEAWAVLRAVAAAAGDPAPGPGRAPGRAPDPGPAPGPGPVEGEEAATSVTVVDDDTLAVDAPAEATLLLLVEAAHELGDVVYLDPGAGLLEVLVEFVEAPACSLLLTLQGRANGTTEVMCTVEALNGTEAPEVGAVVALLGGAAAAVLARSATAQTPEPGTGA